MFNRSRIEHLRSQHLGATGRLSLHYADLQDTTTLRRLLISLQPDEIYHLAGQSHVGLSFEIPESTFQEVAAATLSLLEICRDLPKPVRLYHASSSEIFGAPVDAPQTELTPKCPQNPYGCAKTFATNICTVYRQAYGLFVCSGIAYNHESPRRGENFVTRKISRAAASAAIPESKNELLLGNLNSARDWGWAPEYVEAMWRMLQASVAEDFILATGRLCTVRDFASAAYRAAGIELEFAGHGLQEVGYDMKTGRTLIKVDPAFFRPVESMHLLGDPAQAKSKLDWEGVTAGTDVAVKMVDAELAS